MPRDTQRERVYRAERAAAAEVDGEFWQQTIPNDRLQGYVDDVLTRKAIQSRWGRRHIDVGLKRGGRALAHGKSRITLPKGGRNVFGPFRTRQNAQRFADRVNRRIQAPDSIRAGVDYVMKPRLGELEVAGWFDASEPEENPYELGGKRV